MKILLRWTPLALLLAFTSATFAQTDTLNTLQRELNELKVYQKKAEDDTFAKFFKEITDASTDPDKAMDLYQSAVEALATKPEDGASTDPNNPGQASHTPTPRPHHPKPEKPQTIDDKALTPTLVMAHCGLVRFSALFILKPETPGLKQSFAVWLESVGSNYPDIGRNELKGVAVVDSVITKFYGLNLGDSDEGKWSLKKTPELYKLDVLKPLADANDPKVLTSWNTYGGMLHFDETDEDRWTRVVQPSLVFQMRLAAYKLAPGADKLAALFEVIKQNPLHPEAKDMIATVSDLLAAAKAQFGGGAPSVAPQPSPQPAGPIIIGAGSGH